MSDDKAILLGAVCDKLIANGYVPTSATTPGLFGYRAADHDAGLLLMNDHSCGLEDWSKRRVVALTLTARNPKIRAALVDVLKKYKLDGGPSRIASDESLTFLLRSDSQVFHRESRPAHGEADPAIALDGAGRCQLDGTFPPPRALRLDGEWTKGASPLTVPRASLPEFKDSEAFWTEVEDVLWQHRPKAAPIPPRPLSAERKREIAEEERIEAELAKRDDDSILTEVERRLRHLNSGGFGATPYERQQRIDRAQSPAGRIAIYDEIVAERADEQQRLGRGRRAG